ncbi:MAG: GTP cyclohydrolase II [Candidatus Micrarchaeota archaeon]
MKGMFFPTKFGNFILNADKDGNLLLIYKEIRNTLPVLVRIHSRCTTGDVFQSLRCDCGEQLKKSIEIIKKEGAGIILYLDQEGRGIGLANKIKTYKLQDKGFDTVEANHQLGFKSDMRTYSIASRILKKMGIRRIKLITNNPKKIEGLEKNGIEIVERIPLVMKPNKHNKNYLKTKKERMGHFL